MDKSKILLVVLLVLSVIANIAILKMYTHEREINDFLVSQGVDGRRNFTIAYEYLLTNFATEVSTIHQNYKFTGKTLPAALPEISKRTHKVKLVSLAYNEERAFDTAIIITDETIEFLKLKEVFP